MASHQIMDAQPDAKCNASVVMNEEIEQRVICFSCQNLSTPVVLNANDTVL
jgi:hypothetical protein